MLGLNDFFRFVQVVDRAASLPRAERCGLPNRRSATESSNSRAVWACGCSTGRHASSGMTDAGEDFYRHAVAVLREAELAENAVRHRLSEPSGSIRCTGGVATMQFAMTGIFSD